MHTLVEAWYPGEEHGNALAAVLFGDVDPSGRLPVTFPTGADRVPAMGSPRYPAGPAGYNYDEGLKVGYRAYEADSLSVLFPFGYGVSYTSFAFSKLSVRSTGAAVQVAFTVTNTGSRDGRRGTPGVHPLPARRRRASAAAQGFRAAGPPAA